MIAVVCLLRGVNVGGRNKCAMQELSALCESLELKDPQTYLQSGNVVFRTKQTNLARLAARFQDAFGRKFGFRAVAILRTAEEMREVVAQNPFAKRAAEDPGRFMVMFLAEQPESGAQEKLQQMPRGREELRLQGREIYIYFPDGAGRSRLAWSTLGEKLGTMGTGRNWNTVRRLVEMAERAGGAGPGGAG